MPETMAQPLATTDTADAPVKVLFIAGWGRSGSTLVGNVLGSVDGLVHLGELLLQNFHVADAVGVVKRGIGEFGD